MRLIVQKYGGSSVATPEKLRHAAAKVVATRRRGAQVVVVVSAMGRTTDDLVDLAAAVNARPTPRELDLLLATGEQVSSSLLAMAIQALGEPAVALTGSQSGILTSDTHGGAQVTDVRPGRIRAELEAGRIVVVAGFQGLSSAQEIATLGRGGSDTSAVALASALDADRCQIFTDVAGVFSADPRVVPMARRIDTIGYDAMLELAHQGARVLHAEAVSMARRQGVVVEVRSTFGEAGATRIGASPATQPTSPPKVAGVAGRRDLFAVSGRGTRLEAQVLERTRQATGCDRAVVLCEATGPSDPFQLVVSGENIPNPNSFTERLADELPVQLDNHLGSVSVVGPALGHRPELRHEIESTVSELALRSFHRPVSTTCLVRESHVDQAARTLHANFVEPHFADARTEELRAVAAG